ncbi:MAG: hypothetical protein ACI4JC_09115 [Faecalibacterium sp.]
MKGGQRSWILAALLIWCVLFLRCESTDQSMIRAVMLQKDPQGWTAGLIYQAPEAAADSSEAQAQLRFCASEGETLSKALADAEKALPQKANYRLCDYLLLTPDTAWQQLEEYENLILTHQCGRVAARVFRCDFECGELSAQSEEIEDLPEKLLRQIKDNASAAPMLYDRRSGLLMPCLTLTEEGAGCVGEGVFLSEEGALLLDEGQMSAARLLTGEGGVLTFWLDEEEISLRCRSRTVQPQADGTFVLRLDCQNAAASPLPDETQRAELEQLCTQTVKTFWGRGVDLVGLGAARALRQGGDGMLVPTKNVCPQLRTDVQMMFDF